MVERPERKKGHQERKQEKKKKKRVALLERDESGWLFRKRLRILQARFQNAPQRWKREAKERVKKRVKWSVRDLVSEPRKKDAVGGEQRAWAVIARERAVRRDAG